MLQAILNGILLGGLYAAMAMGLSLIFGVLRIINIAHAAFALLSAYLAYWAFTRFAIDPLLSLVISVPFILVVGLVIYKGVIVRLRKLDAAPVVTLLVLFGVANVLEGSLSLIFGADFKTINTAYAATAFHLGGFTFQTTRLISFLVAVVLMISLGLFFKKTFLGKAIRATVDQRRGALLVGIDTERVEQVAFLIGLAMAAIGGTLLGMVVAFYPFLHFFWIGKVFAIVVLGGLGSIVGALLGGVILGVVENITGTLAPVVWSEIVAYVLLFMTLLIRPTGLLGRRT